jgi:broad specificity phosphatase PhoE
LGAELAGRNPRVIVSSPLRRAVETAAPLARRTGLVTVIDERLADRHYGEWAGVKARDVVARWGSLDAAPGVEPADEVRGRVLAALGDIAESAAGTAAVVVSHDAVNRIVLCALDPGLGAPDDLAQETGCFNTLECHKQANGQLSWSLLSINQVPQ